MVISYLLTSMSSPHDLCLVRTKNIFFLQNGPNFYLDYEQFKPLWIGNYALSDLYCEMRPKERRLSEASIHPPTSICWHGDRPEGKKMKGAAGIDPTVPRSRDRTLTNVLPHHVDMGVKF